VVDSYNLVTALVGSHAHGLDRENSDKDYRSIYIKPTSDILSLPFSTTYGSHDFNKGNDVVAYEIGHFLSLAIKSNPSILEIFAAPWEYEKSNVLNTVKYGYELRKLFPYVWSSKYVYDAFSGYSYSQRKKMVDISSLNSSKQFKLGATYLRILLLGIELLSYGILNIKISTEWITPLRQIRNGEWSTEKILDTGSILQNSFETAYKLNPSKEVNLDPINTYLLDIRKEFWN